MSAAPTTQYEERYWKIVELCLYHVFGIVDPFPACDYLRSELSKSVAGASVFHSEPLDVAFDLSDTEPYAKGIRYSEKQLKTYKDILISNGWQDNWKEIKLRILRQSQFDDQDIYELSHRLSTVAPVNLDIWQMPAATGLIDGDLDIAVRGLDFDSKDYRWFEEIQRVFVKFTELASTRQQHKIAEREPLIRQLEFIYETLAIVLCMVQASHLARVPLFVEEMKSQIKTSKILSPLSIQTVTACGYPLAPDEFEWEKHSLKNEQDIWRYWTIKLQIDELLVYDSWQKILLKKDSEQS